MNQNRPRLSLLCAALVAAAPAAAAPTGAELALSSRAGARLQAVATLSGNGAGSLPCLTPWAQASRSEATAPPAVRRALGLLNAEASLGGERRIVDREIVVRYSIDRGSPDRLDLADDNANGRPDAVDAVLTGSWRAQKLLTGALELPALAGVEVVLARLGSGIDGVMLPSRDGRVTIWLDPTGRNPATLRRNTEHQIAHAILGASGLSPAWSEAFATWVASELEGGPDERATAALAQRLSRMAEGLDRDDLTLAPGNAAWFAFLDQAYGRTALKLGVEELARGGGADAALDRALRRAGGGTFAEAFRDFHLWSVLTGPRDDGRHFSFASRLPAATLAGAAEMLPALSIQADPEVAPLGAAAVLLAPTERTGGLAVRFEGDRTTRWAVDLLLVRTDGSMHRVPFGLGEDDAGDLTVPLQDLREALVLVRNLDGEGRTPRRYTWSAYVEPGYPTEISRLSVESAGARRGMIVSWETLGERGVLGFNVLRSRPGDAAETRINPVWIPAIGETGVPAAYSFFDAGARTGVDYQYRIEAVTPEGLVSRSDAVASPAR